MKKPAPKKSKQYVLPEIDIYTRELQRRMTEAEERIAFLFLQKDRRRWWQILPINLTFRFLRMPFRFPKNPHNIPNP